jgi:hypothetical protein
MKTGYVIRLFFAQASCVNARIALKYLKSVCLILMIMSLS